MSSKQVYAKVYRWYRLVEYYKARGYVSAARYVEIAINWQYDDYPKVAMAAHTSFVVQSGSKS